MKRRYFSIVFLLVAAAFCAAEGIAEQAVRGNEKAETSYSFGMIIASELVDTGIEFNYEAFIQGFRNTMERKKTSLTMDEAYEKVDAAFLVVQERYYEQVRLEAEKNLAASKAFLEENSKRPGVTITPSGLQFELISEGSGEMPGPADTVLVHYQGATIDGAVFDSSYERGTPLEAPLYMVIPGWSEGLRLMKEGSKARLYIPPDLAYG